MTTAVLICPGRGSYITSELGTLARYFPDSQLLARFDEICIASGAEALTELDAATQYSADKHGRGDNASGLIFAAGLGDAMAVSDEIEIVAVTGNSMGWYTTLACAGAVSAEDGFAISTTMGRLMHEHGSGGQLLYPHMGADWRIDPAAKTALLSLVSDIAERPNHALSLSINLGGFLVLAGNEAGLAAFEASVPKRESYPMRLAGHAGFHSPLVAPVSEIALSDFPVSLFEQPRLPMIDGRGHIWWPGASDVNALWDYTFGHQVTQPYDFTHAVTVAAREFAPEFFIIAGPGTSLGGSVAQCLITANWLGLTSKPEFRHVQESAPCLISMGREDQRCLVTKGH